MLVFLLLYFISSNNDFDFLIDRSEIDRDTIKDAGAKGERAKTEEFNRAVEGHQLKVR